MMKIKELISVNIDCESLKSILNNVAKNQDNEKGRGKSPENLISFRKESNGSLPASMPHPNALLLSGIGQCAESPERRKFCSSCGTAAKLGDNFCSSCGKILSKKYQRL